MERGHDPFRAVQEAVSGTLVDITAELVRWRKLPSRNPKCEPLRQKILSALSELRVDLQDMQATIDIALKDPAKYALTPSELMSRQDFVRDLQAQANDAHDELQSGGAAGGGGGGGGSGGCGTPSSANGAGGNGAGGGSGRSVNARVDRQTLLSGGSTSVASDDTSHGAGSSGGWGAARGRQDAAWAENEASVSSHMQQQEQVLEHQDVELGVLGQSLDRLGHSTRAHPAVTLSPPPFFRLLLAAGGCLQAGACRRMLAGGCLLARVCLTPCSPARCSSPCAWTVGKTINAELRQQGRELDLLTEDVDDTRGRMAAATAAMKAMLKKKDRGKLCCILILTIVLIFLSYAVLAW